ncbi:MAG: type III polyketide synthase [Bacteroidota bacterium]
MLEPKPYINYIGTAVPEHKIPQTQIGRFMSEALNMNEEAAHKLEVLYRASGIRYRHSVLADYARPVDQFEFYPANKSLDPFPNISQRMRVYEEEAIKLSLNAIENALPSHFDYSSVTHLITISCTGMYAPGLDIEIVRELGLSSSVHRTAINFMGCYAAFNGFKLAASICKGDPNACVLLVAVELCTIHFQKDLSEDTLLANALFSDGAAAALITASPTNGSLKMENFHSDIAFSGIEEMAWQIDHSGFVMKLTALVPTIIEQHIESLTEHLLKSLGISLEDIDYYAIHPGGKRILAVIERKLKIKAHQNRTAHEVLKEFGNMSSPTILFVLKELQAQLKGSTDTSKLLSFAFGPGLTLESMLLERVGDEEL